MGATFVDCIAWDGAVRRGYPMRGKRLAHRTAYEKAGRTIPAGHVLHHVCDNKACVNVAHLVPLTPRAHMLLHRSWERSSAARAAKTHCLRGHPLTERNIIGQRFCRTCRNDQARERKRVAAMMLAETVDEQPAEPFTEPEGETDG